MPTRVDVRALVRGPAIAGLAVAVVLMLLAGLIPAMFNWNVHMRSWPPLHAYWDPRVGPGTAPAVLIAVLGVIYAARFAQTASWRMLLLGSYGTALAWLASLALVDGNSGIGVILNYKYEYLNTARMIDSWSALSTMLHEYVARIDADHPHNWPTHIAGHPPGAVMFFIALVAIGLGSGLAAGWVVIIVSSTTAVAVLQTLRVLGQEDVARRAAPFLVLGPAAIWMAVSADAVFGTVAAWGTCCLAVAATRSATKATALWSVLAGLLLGYCVMMSYGLALLAVLAVAVLVITRRWAPLAWVAGAGLAVLLAFYAAGFAWWDGLPALHVRQFRGVAASRPQQYYLWGNLAALAWSAGPVMYSGLAVLVGRRCSSWREILAARSGALASTRVIALLSLAGVAMVLGADVSGASRGEVERIWLPFVPWLLVATALLPRPWRRVGLVLQVTVALLAQHMLHSDW
ncbi:MAG: hypothetical protein WAK18_12395 [Nocardioidaceae bacterium]